MCVKPVDNVSFKAQHHLKTLWKKGLLPTVTKGFYGDELTIDTVSLEHLDPVSLGGRTIEENLVLASKRKNNARGNKPLYLYTTMGQAWEYLVQFVDVKVRGFDGNRYINRVMKKLKQLNIK